MPYFDQYGPQWDQTSPNAARDYGFMIDEAGAVAPPGQDIFSRLFRSLFGPRQTQPDKITQQELPPLPGYEQANGPFGGAPQTKPATQLSSAQQLAQKVSRMIGMPDAPPPPTSDDFLRSMTPMADYNFGPMPPMDRPPPGPVPDYNFGPLPARSAPINMRTIPGAPSAAGPTPFGLTVPGLTGSVLRRADGGDVPGYRRGGYPQLYNAPVRRTFDSGGESYVGQQYNDSSGGRADDVNAKLSAREYVMDAETMALLGDGNPDHGAKKMDELRANIRKHKGKALAKGKISPDAKPASAYIAGNPLGDGIRRAGKKNA